MTRLVIAHFVPTNGKARTVLTESFAEAKLDSHHQIRHYASSSISINDGGPSKHETPLDPTSLMIALSIEPTKLPEIPNLGWRIGDGEKVDVRITARHREEINNTSRVHFLVRIHPGSGILMLRAGPDEKNIRYQDVDNEIKSLVPNEQLSLIRPITPIIFTDGREYDIRLTANSSTFPALNKFVRDTYRSFLHEGGKNNLTGGLLMRQDHYAIGPILGFGTFGDVNYAVNIQTGAPIALKHIRAHSRSWQDTTKQEIKIMENLKDVPYILQIVETWCGHGEHPQACQKKGTSTHHFFVAVELALFDFASKEYFELPYATRLELSRQLLSGIKSLHERGVMHRDVSARNAFVMQVNPPKAALGDFGKAIESLHGKDTGIGPITYCAPEVWDKDYTEAVDLWAWAFLSLFNLFGFMPSHICRNEHMSVEKLGKIHEYLNSKLEDSECGPLAKLLLKIFVWDPQKRISIEEALSHDAWDKCDSADASVDRASKKRKFETIVNAETDCQERQEPKDGEQKDGEQKDGEQKDGEQKDEEGEATGLTTPTEAFSEEL